MLSPQRSTRSLILGVLALSPLAAHAQDAWQGAYVGGHAGYALKPDDGGDRFLFDTNLDGQYRDTVRTAAGADAFSPGSCNGVAKGSTPAAGCSENTGGADYGLRGGYDWRANDWVFGLVGEVSTNDVRDAVSSFSTTPASYTMLRKVDAMASLRMRIGHVFGESNLVYITGGVARAEIQNTYLTTNTANTFTNNGDSKATGAQWGAGYERLIGERFTVGLEYIRTQLSDKDYTVRSSGPAPATNPFLLVNPAGTDFRRSDSGFDVDSVRVTASYRF